MASSENPLRELLNRLTQQDRDVLVALKRQGGRGNRNDIGQAPRSAVGTAIQSSTGSSGRSCCGNGFHDYALTEQGRTIASELITHFPAVKQLAGFVGAPIAIASTAATKSLFIFIDECLLDIHLCRRACTGV